MATSNVIAVFNGVTPFDVNVAANDLLTDLSVKDFTVSNVSLNVLESNTLWTKVTPTLLRYSGGSPTLVAGNTLEIRRKTPNNVVAPVTYATRFSSDAYNQELDRMIRWREEADLNGVGAGASGLAAIPNNDPYSLAWGNDSISPPTRQALFGYFNSTIGKSRKNKIINGRFDIWQQGIVTALTGATGTAVDQRSYIADKWIFINNSASGTAPSLTVSRVDHAIGQTVVPDNPKYFYRVNLTAFNTPTGQYSGRLIQLVENLVQFSGKTVTLSLYARSSVVGKTLGYRIMRNGGVGGSGSADLGVAGTWALTSEFTRKSITFTVPSLSGLTIGTEGTDYLFVALYLYSSSGEVPASVNFGVGTVDISDVQLEFGDTPTSIEQIPFTEELVNCMRYYQQSSPYGSHPAGTTYGGRNIQYPSSASGQWADTINFPITMATTPLVNVYSASGTINNISRAGVNAPATVTNIHSNGFFLFNNSGTSFATIFYGWAAWVALI